MYRKIKVQRAYMLILREAYEIMVVSWITRDEVKTDAGLVTRVLQL